MFLELVWLSRIGSFCLPSFRENTANSLNWCFLSRLRLVHSRDFLAYWSKLCRATHRRYLKFWGFTEPWIVFDSTPFTIATDHKELIYNPDKPLASHSAAIVQWWVVDLGSYCSWSPQCKADTTCHFFSRYRRVEPLKISFCSRFSPVETTLWNPSPGKGTDMGVALQTRAAVSRGLQTPWRIVF